MTRFALVIGNSIKLGALSDKTLGGFVIALLVTSEISLVGHKESD